MYQIYNQRRNFNNISMEWLCTLFLPQNELRMNTSNFTLTSQGNTGTHGYALTTYNQSGQGTQDYTVPVYNNSAQETALPGTTQHEQEAILQTAHMESWDILDWTNKVYVPTLCCLGIAGNLLNAAILSKRIREGNVTTFL